MTRQKWIDYRHANPSLSRMAGYAVGSIVFLAGYIILQISGMTNVAFTVLGGTVCSVWWSVLPSKVSQEFPRQYLP